jgi:2-methylcitrate dehydratase PrpD
MAIVAEPREIKIAPRNDLEAIASLPFMVAAALCDGRVDLSTLRPESIGRADLLAVAARITCEADDRLGSGFDGRMEVVHSNGDAVSYPVTMTPTRGERIMAKFRANMEPAPPAPRAKLERALLEDKPNARAIARLATAAMSGRGGAYP